MESRHLCGAALCGAPEYAASCTPLLSGTRACTSTCMQSHRVRSHLHACRHRLGHPALGIRRGGNKWLRRQAHALQASADRQALTHAAASPSHDDAGAWNRVPGGGLGGSAGYRTTGASPGMWLRCPCVPRGGVGGAADYRVTAACAGVWLRCAVLWLRRKCKCK